MVRDKILKAIEILKEENASLHNPKINEAIKLLNDALRQLDKRVGQTKLASFYRSQLRLDQVNLS